MTLAEKDGGMVTWPSADRWHDASDYQQFVQASTEHCDLWTGVYRLAREPAWAVVRGAAAGAQSELSGCRAHPAVSPRPVV